MTTTHTVDCQPKQDLQTLWTQKSTLSLTSRIVLMLFVCVCGGGGWGGDGGGERNKVLVYVDKKLNCD